MRHSHKSMIGSVFDRHSDCSGATMTNFSRAEAMMEKEGQETRAQSKNQGCFLS